MHWFTQSQPWVGWQSPERLIGTCQILMWPTTLLPVLGSSTRSAKTGPGVTPLEAATAVWGGSDSVLSCLVPHSLPCLAHIMLLSHIRARWDACHPWLHTGRGETAFRPGPHPGSQPPNQLASCLAMPLLAPPHAGLLE